MASAESRQAYGGRGRDDLPFGWEEVRAGDILGLFNGFPFKPADWESAGLPIIRIQNLNNPNASFNYYSGDLAPRFRVESGDLLFAWSGTPGTSFGAHIWAGGPAWLNQHIFRVEFDQDRIDKRFLRLAINRNLESYIAEAHGGVGLAHITKGRFEDGLLVLPPLTEQQRIVAKVEALLARVNAARDRLAHVPAILKRFRQSVLAAACSGRLTEDWRSAAKRTVSRPGDDGLPPEWRIRPLHEVCVGFRYGSSKKSIPEGEIPVLRMGNLQSGEIDWTDLVFSSDTEELCKYRLEPMSVLFNRTNSPDLVGKTAIYRGERPAIFAGYLIHVEHGPKLDPEYLNYCMNAPRFREFCAAVRNDAVSQSNINAKKLAGYALPWCSLDEQRTIARRVKALFALADTIEQRAAIALSRADRLTQSILAKAFRGDLASCHTEITETESSRC